MKVRKKQKWIKSTVDGPQSANHSMNVLTFLLREWIKKDKRKKMLMINSN